MIEHRHVIFVLAVVKVAKRDVTAVRSLTMSALLVTCLEHNENGGLTPITRVFVLNYLAGQNV